MLRLLTVLSLACSALVAEQLTQFDTVPNLNIADPVAIPAAKDVNENPHCVLNKGSTNQIKICLAPGCAKAGAHIISSLNESVDPCEDFFDFTCGGWIQKHFRRAELLAQDYHDQFSVQTKLGDDIDRDLRYLLEKDITESEPSFVKKMKNMFQSCVKMAFRRYDEMVSLRKILEELGGWPMAEGGSSGDKPLNGTNFIEMDRTWNVTTLSGSNSGWIDTLAKIRAMGFDHNTLLQLTVVQDPLNKTENILKLSLPSSNRLEKLGANNDSSMTYLAENLGVNNETAGSVKQGVLEFLDRFKGVRDQWESDALPKFNRYTKQELKDQVPRIDLEKFFNGLLPDTIHENELLILADPHSLTMFADLMNSIDKRVVANYMLWRVAYEYMDITHRVLKKVSVHNQRCLNIVREDFDVALNYYYVKWFFPDIKKYEAMVMFDYMKDELKNILDKSEWMDEDTKEFAKEKVEDVKSIDGYPRELLNNEIVSHIYEKLNFKNASGDYFDKYLEVRKWRMDSEFSLLRFITPSWRKYANVANTSAVYDHLANAIHVPAGIMQGPYFYFDVPIYINFGGLGSVMARKLLEGLYNQGKKFDKDGNEVDWWDDVESALFQKNADCLVKQYNNYASEQGIQPNHTDTQDDHVSYIGGLRLAYLGYKEWYRTSFMNADQSKNTESERIPGLETKYTPDQLFWISYGSSMCGINKLPYKRISQDFVPFKLRVNGPISNRPEFARDFNCRLGSKMNPQDKCKVW